MLDYAGGRFTDAFRNSLFLPEGTLSRQFPPQARSLPSLRRSPHPGSTLSSAARS